MVNTRNLSDVARSRWWRDRPDPATELARLEVKLLHLRDTLGDAAYHVHYDDFVADPTGLAGLFTWLGEPFDLATVNRVLGTRHSS